MTVTTRTVLSLETRSDGGSPVEISISSNGHGGLMLQSYELNTDVQLTPREVEAFIRAMRFHMNEGPAG